MDTQPFSPPPPPPPPPPIPPQKSGARIGLIIAGVIVGLIVLVAILAALALPVFHRAREKAQARQAALKDMDKALAEESDKMAKSLREGNEVDRNAAANRIKEQLEKSADKIGSSDEAAAARAMAAFLGRIQGESAKYEAAQKKFIAAETLKFNFSDRAAIDDHRKITQEFLDANAKLTDVLRHSEEIVSSELDAAHVSPATKNATLSGFKRSHGELSPVMLRVRGEDDELGKTVLTLLDILDREWGKWRIDPGNGKLVVPDATTRETVNKLLDKVQQIAAAQNKDQIEVAEKMKAGHQQ